MVRFIIIVLNDKYKNYNDLHSNMVRFIMFTGFSRKSHNVHLHSNMVRFIMRLRYDWRNIISYIYIPIWLDLLYIIEVKTTI